MDLTAHSSVLIVRCIIMRLFQDFCLSMEFQANLSLGIIVNLLYMQIYCNYEHFYHKTEPSDQTDLPFNPYLTVLVSLTDTQNIGANGVTFVW